MASLIDSFPDDVETLKALLAARDIEIGEERSLRVAAQAEAARASASVSSAEALIAHMKLAIEKLRRELYGSRSERGRKLLDQMELELEDLEASATQDEIAAEMAAKSAGTSFVPAHTRKKPVRKPFPEHLSRERVIVPCKIAPNIDPTRKV